MTAAKTAQPGSYVIVGMGLTGLSCARYLRARNIAVVLVDSRATPPALEEARCEMPDLNIVTGALQTDLLQAAENMIVSPGVSLQEPAIAQALRAGVTLSSDIDLFVAADQQPLLAITGSNGKTTVTTLVGNMAKRSGKHAAVGGNIGVPALELLTTEHELSVLELSSFQLERCRELRARVATVLNVSADHMDRYADIQAYQRAKLAIYAGAENIVVNRHDPLTRPLLANHVQWWSFGLDVPQANAFGILQQGASACLAFEDQALLPLSELRLVGSHNLQNALAALAIGKAAGLAMDSMLAELREFEGLPHRCQWVAEINGVQFINDSKGTNIGATVAAIEGLASPAGQRLVLIAGGQGKGADFSALTASVQQHVRAAVLIGTDAKTIDAAISAVTDTCFALDMPAAVQAACAIAQPGDSVLFSPACASFDMFSGFEQRGQAFIDAVRAQAEVSSCAPR